MAISISVSTAPPLGRTHFCTCEGVLRGYWNTCEVPHSNQMLHRKYGNISIRAE